MGKGAMMNSNFILGVVYVGVWVVLAIRSVGDIPTNAPFGWDLPVWVGLAFGMPFILGYLAGKGKEL